VRTEFVSPLADQEVKHADETDAYNAYTKMKSTIINYETVANSIRNDDWFGEDSSNTRYN
jgi:hypothetical protein